MARHVLTEFIGTSSATELRSLHMLFLRLGQM